MKITVKAKELEIAEKVDVLVVGGGPAGIGAAVSAARAGSSVLLLERRAFLGGNITASYVETCNWFLHGTKFSAHGLYSEIEKDYRARYGRSHDIRENAPHRFSSEYLKIFLDELMIKEKVKVLLYSFVNDVVVEGDHIQGAIIQTKQGPMAVAASVIIDATGDGDVAFAAGVPFKQGRDKDGYCQPGTLNFRIAGLDARALTEGGDKLKEIAKQFTQDYLAGKTGLDCKRKDLPFGRLTSAGIISYINYPCSYMIDPTSNVDLTKGEIECRGYIKQFYGYMKDHFPGFEKIEIASIAPEIGFRDSRRIQGKYTLTHEDIEGSKTFDDVICIFPRMYDMLSPDGFMGGDGSLESGGNHGHIYVHIKEDDTRSFGVPYRCLVPERIDNLLVAGRCISTTHVAESSIRAIYACMLTGQAAGVAASLSVKANVMPEQVDITNVQGTLKTMGVL
ncbi:membrane protein [Spirochaetia bacterium]|nr:membrane protein [Spirochaetia bacterium]